MGLRFDIQNQLSDEQDFTTGPAVSTNSYKKQSASQDISIGRRLALLCLPTTDAGTGTTVKIEAIQADDAALTSNVEVLNTVEVLAANAIKGEEIEVPIPQGVMDKQYLGARVTCTGGTETVSLDIYIVPQDEIAKYKSFTKVNHAIVQ